MNIREYLNAKVDPNTRKKVAYYFSVDDLGEPFISIEYTEVNGEKVSLMSFDSAQDMDKVKEFAKEITTKTRKNDRYQNLPPSILPVILDGKTKYLKPEKNRKNMQLNEFVGIKETTNDDILLGFVLDEKVSKQIRSLEDKIGLLEECMYIGSLVNENCTYQFSAALDEKLENYGSKDQLIVRAK